MSAIERGRGERVPYADYIRFINEVFGFTGGPREFEKLLPKLYRPERCPQASNYVVREEDGFLAAAVGAYSHDLMVCGHLLHCRGIGNVAVSAERRSLGYMKDCMNRALDDMVKDGVALSSLGGLRQRYGYFSYEAAGEKVCFTFTKTNLRHVYGTVEAPFDGYREVTDPADPAIDEIMELIAHCPCAPVRKRADFLDIAHSWFGKLFEIRDGGRFVGYVIMEDDGWVPEVRTVRDADFMPLLRTVLAHQEQNYIRVDLPAFDAAYQRDLHEVAESTRVECSMRYTVLDFRAVVEAFLELKQTAVPLPNGSLTLRIHGRGGEECLRVTIRDGVSSVKPLPLDTPADYEFSHLAAMDFLFAPCSPRRDQADPLSRVWFPLPLWVYRADEV